MYGYYRNSDYVSEAHYPVLGAIDIGTNSCRLLVAKVNIAKLSKSFFASKQNTSSWKVIHSFGKVVRLGEELHKNYNLSERSMQRALDTLLVCRKKMERLGVSKARAVATEACRKAGNAQEFVERVLKEANLDIEVITGEEEARLVLTGCSGLLLSTTPYGVIFDIGGGSTEVVLVRILTRYKKNLKAPVSFEVIASTSIPYGVVTCTESLKGFGGPRELYDYVKSQVTHELRQFLMKNDAYSELTEDNCQMLGSSGTVTTMFAIHNGLNKYVRQNTDNLLVKVESLRKVCREISNLTLEERTSYPCVGKGRSELILAGASILEGVFDAVPLDTIRIADRGIREGILIDLLDSIKKHSKDYDFRPPKVVGF